MTTFKSGSVGRSIWIAILAFAAVSQAHAQGMPFAQELAAAGDSPTTALPLAKDLSATLSRPDIAKAMRKVGDWQLQRAQPLFNQTWEFGALYAGFMAVPKEVAGSRYQDAMLGMGQKFNWQLGPRLEHADDQVIGQTYLELYLRSKDKAMLSPTQSRIDEMMRLPDPQDKPLWWWCDALFMAPPVLARLSTATGEREYLDFMDRQWWITSGLLYDPAAHLYSRDASFLDKHEANGKKIFWSRGNGWVMAGLVRVLQKMPKDYPSRKKYEAQFKEMAGAVLAVQGADGLWRPWPAGRKGLSPARDFRLCIHHLRVGVWSEHWTAGQENIQAGNRTSVGRTVVACLRRRAARLHPAGWRCAGRVHRNLELRVWSGRVSAGRF